MPDLPSTPDLAAEAAPPVMQTPTSRERLQRLADHLNRSSTGVQARLRRSHPMKNGGEALFESEAALQAAGIEARGERREHWAVVLHCLAIARGRHRYGDDNATGKALATIWKDRDARLRQLVEADVTTLCDLLPRLARRLDTADLTVDWWPLTELLIYTDDRAQRARRRLVSGYLRSFAPASSSDER